MYAMSQHIFGGRPKNAASLHTTQSQVPYARQVGAGGRHADKATSHILVCGVRQVQYPVCAWVCGAEEPGRPKALQQTGLL